MASTASELTERDLSEALYWLGIDVTDDTMEHVRVMAEAMHLYVEREKTRGALWEKAGAEDCAHNLRHKALRVGHADGAEQMEAAVDDAHDAINYAAFYVRNVQAGRLAES